MTTEMNVAIGFATGRRSFPKVLRTYIHSWEESGLVDDKSIALHLLVAYDLDYQNTRVTDFSTIHPELSSQLDSKYFIGGTTQKEEINALVHRGVVSRGEADAIFGRGYAAKRNSILFSAIKRKMDCLMFIDDDEYPLAVTNTRNTAIWSGQQVLLNHLKHIDEADITYGYHCGYISPIPFLEFDDDLTEDIFRSFIEAISNDIINWNSLREIMNNGGVSYADTSILVSSIGVEVAEVKGAKFISGSNLCINLTNPKRVFPFYNPPMARGEDTFLSTCLNERRVIRVPTYTFHDGFSTYNSLLEGVLPIHLKRITADNEKTVERFYRACVGWVRYKPLLTYITEPDHYDEKMEMIRDRLNETIPVVSRFFNYPKFIEVIAEFEKYQRNVKKHYKQFLDTQSAWSRLMAYLDSN